MRRVSTLGITLVLSFAGMLQAQSPNATVTGRVTDQSKAVISDAKVTLINAGTNIRYEGSTNETGSYYVTDLPVGTYRMEIGKIGFNTVIKPGIVLHVQDAVEINVELALGSVAEAITVQAGVSPVQLTSSSISAVVSSTSVRELPLNGRDWTLLAALQPGVTSLDSSQKSNQGGARANTGFGSELSISGGRPAQNNYRIDGVNANDYFNGAPGNVTGAALGVDAVEEFSVLTSNYSAEYGRTSGGVVNTITRSGTNQFHGDAYEFLRNSDLDAANFFDNFNNLPKAPFRRNQFGASGGGPIRKDRTFFFADYEGLRQSLGETNTSTVPSPDARNGIFHNADGTTTTVNVNPLVKPFLVLWPSPNGPLQGTGDIGIFSLPAQTVTTENFVTARIDHKISEASTLLGSYEFDKGLSSLPDPLNDLFVGQRKGRQLIALELSHSFSPRLINSVRFGFNRVAAEGPLTISAINPAAADPSLAAVSGFDAPQIRIPGITTFSGGLNNRGFTRVFYNSFQGYDDAFLTRGIQSFKFGVAVERMQEYILQDNTDGGQYQFGTLQDFLTNTPSSLVAGLPGLHTPRGYRQTIFAGYAQDDVRWRPNLTFNLGMRYEMSTAPTEVQGKLSDLHSLTDVMPHLGNPLFSNPTRRNFEPRIGFAWDPFGDGKTAVRGGFGLFDVLPLFYGYALTEANPAPFTQQGRTNSLPQGSFPTAGFALLAGLSQLREAYIEPNPHRTYVMQWNFNVQRELARDLSMLVAYVGNRGVHQIFRGDDANMVLPTLTSAGWLWPSPAASGTVINPKFGRIDYTDWSGNSFYNALELQIQKRISHGFQVQGSYTWGKSIDEGSSGTVGDPYTNSISNQFFFDRRLRRGLSDFNVGQNLVINYVWTIPSAKSLHGPAAWASNGWQLGGIFEASTGHPFTPLVGGDPMGSNDSSPFAYPNRLTGPGCQSAVNPGNPNYINLSCFGVPNPLTLLGNTGRNSLTGPGLENFDFSIFKNNYIRRVSEAFNVQFRAEFFNVFNRANFEPPNDNNTIFDQSGAPVSGAGLIDATSTTAREIQFAVKLMW